MARIDDFKNALALTQKMFGEFDPETVAENSGAGIKKISPEEFQLNLRMFNKDYRISWPKGIIEMLSQGKEPSVPEQVLLMRYLVNSKNIPVNGTDITFRQVPGGDSYFSAFIKRAQGPMTGFFGANPTLLHQTGIELGGRKAARVIYPYILIFFQRSQYGSLYGKVMMSLPLKGVSFLMKQSSGICRLRTSLLCQGWSSLQ